MSDIVDIFRYAISSVSPERLIKESVRLEGESLIIKNRSFDLSRYKKIYIIGAGKASPGMAEEVERILKDSLTTLAVWCGYKRDKHYKETYIQYKGWKTCNGGISIHGNISSPIRCCRR